MMVSIYGKEKEKKQKTIGKILTFVDTDGVVRLFI